MTDYELGELLSEGGPEAITQRPLYSSDTSTEEGMRYRVWKLATEKQEKMAESMLKKYKETGNKVYATVADWYTGGADNLPIDN